MFSTIFLHTMLVFIAINYSNLVSQFQNIHVVYLDLNSKGKQKKKKMKKKNDLLTIKSIALSLRLKIPKIIYRMACFLLEIISSIFLRNGVQLNLIVCTKVYKKIRSTFNISINNRRIKIVYSFKNLRNNTPYSF